jgi:hypothetical protein
MDSTDYERHSRAVAATDLAPVAPAGRAAGLRAGSRSSDKKQERSPAH